MGSELSSVNNLIGEVVGGRYFVEGILGAGGMGTVYSARHKVTNRSVALKRLHPHLAHSKSLRSRFLREARAVGTLHHPNVIEILDAGLDKEGTPFVIFERLRGQDFAESLEAGLFTPADIFQVLLEALEGLSAAHHHGFVHRDIKPANIYITEAFKPLGSNLSPTRERGTVKILDFGVVRALQPSGPSLTHAGAPIGTPAFMSPEQLFGDTVDARADLWSVGIVLFFALTGELPFRSQNLAALVGELRRGLEPPSNRYPYLSPEIDRFFTQALHPKLGARFQSTNEMQSALRVLSRALKAEVTPAPSPYAWEEALGDIARETEQLRRVHTSHPPSSPRPPARNAASASTSWWTRVLKRSNK